LRASFGLLRKERTDCWMERERDRKTETREKLRKT